MSDYFTTKQDQGKLDWSLLPREAWLIELSWEEREGIVRVMQDALPRYGRGTWRTVPDAVQRYRAAAQRHLAAIRGGEDLDQQSHLPHQWHVLTNLVFVFALELELELRPLELRPSD